MCEFNIATSLFPTNTDVQKNSYFLTGTKKEKKKYGVSDHHVGGSRVDILL